MELSYCECAVKREDRRLKLFKFLWILACIYLFIINLLFIPKITFSCVVLICVLALIIYWPNFSGEYEYVYCDGQIDFDLIRNGRKRKTLQKIDLVDAELVCGIYDEERLSKFDSKFFSKKNYFSGVNYKGAYYIILRQGNQYVRIGFEPNEKLLACIKNKKPRITFEYKEEE